MTRSEAAPSIRAAGGVVWRPAPDITGEGGVEVAVIHRPQYDDWSLPKGKLAPGENEIDGAVREVLEETGCRVRVGRPLGEVRYLKVQNGVTRPKVVRWWAMAASGGTFTPGREVDELRWLSLAQARELVTRPSDAEILVRFAQGPAPTWTVLVVRHASAGSRASWSGDDRDRPLDECGSAQADGLVRLLARYDVADIASADVTRCLQTVAPLARAFGLRIRSEPLLSELSYPGREPEAAALVRAIGGPDRDAVVCTHGDVINDLVHRIAADDEVTLRGSSTAKKGGTWALTFSTHGLFDAEYMAPPAVVECEKTDAG